MSDPDVAELVRVNSHELTATLLVTERLRRREDASLAAQRHREVMATLDRAQRVGLRVLAAERAGRKTVRVADVLGADE